MSATEIDLGLNPTNSGALNRLLGNFALIGAPMLLIFFIFGNLDSNAPKTLKDQFLALTGVLYIGGWIAGAIGVRRSRVTGKGAGSKIVFIIQIILLSFAFLFSALEVAGFNDKNGGLLFKIADAGYPLSHLFMIVVGIFTLRARVWSGFARFAPFLVGLALPVFLPLSGVIGMTIGGFAFGLMTSIGLGTIGWQLMKNKF